MTSIPSICFPVALVDLLLELAEGQALGVDVADHRQREGAFRGDLDDRRLAAADSRSAIHHRPQVLQPRVHPQRCPR